MQKVIEKKPNVKKALAKRIAKQPSKQKVVVAQPDENIIDIPKARLLLKR